MYEDIALRHGAGAFVFALWILAAIGGIGLLVMLPRNTVRPS